MKDPLVSRRAMIAAAGAVAAGTMGAHGAAAADDQGRAAAVKPRLGQRPHASDRLARLRAMADPRDHIRTVPLKHVAHAAAPAAQPLLVYHGGPLISAVKVFTVFWGQAWSSSLKDTASKLNAYFDYVLKSALLDQLKEYSVEGLTIGQGERIGTVTLTDSEPGSTVTDGALQTKVLQEISNGKLPAPDADTLYFVYLPPGVVSVMGGGKSCVQFCGYHSDINRRVFYALMPYPDCDGCKGGLSEFDALTSTSSHELCEAITDPIPGEGWYDDTNGEIGDICAWQTKKLGAYTVQLEWSNAAKRCE